MERLYLAGGTGLALQLGHRESCDQDFFSQAEFDTFAIIQALSAAGHFRLTGEATGTVQGFLNDVRKITAISSRGRKKDFIDLHFISQQVIPLESLFGLMEKKYPGVDCSVYHLIRSLAYFDDADREPDPIMRSGVSWSETKDYLRAQQRSLVRVYLGPDDIGG